MNHFIIQSTSASAIKWKLYTGGSPSTICISIVYKLGTCSGSSPVLLNRKTPGVGVGQLFVLTCTILLVECDSHCSALLWISSSPHLLLYPHYELLSWLPTCLRKKKKSSKEDCRLGTTQPILHCEFAAKISCRFHNPSNARPSTCTWSHPLPDLKYTTSLILHSLPLVSVFFFNWIIFISTQTCCYFSHLEFLLTPTFLASYCHRFQNLRYD